MKLLKHKHFMSLIYSVLVALPFFAILGRVIYTQSNHNATQSYYGETINETKYNDVINSNELISGNTYLFQSSSGRNELNNVAVYYYVENIHNLISNISFSYDYSEISYFRLTYYTDNYLAFYSSDNATLGTYNISTQYNISFIFTYLSSALPSNTNISPYLDSYIKYAQYNKYSYLDNAFEYSLSTFVTENDFGKLNFFSWFYDLFLSNTSRNNLYIHFINWYMNYVLLVSLTYVLFLVLMWFVSFVRRLLENTQNMNIGGL